MSVNEMLMAAAGTGGANEYVEDVFSTYLHSGNDGTQTITNGIDLSTEGGLVWVKRRSDIRDHRWTDTARGATKSISSNLTDAEITEVNGITAFTTSGFSIGNDAEYNAAGATYASWTFRKAKKFFDVVTYTGNGTNRTISHSLGSVPGMIIVKRTDTTGDWQVYHRSLVNTEYLVLNSTAAKATGTTRWNSTTPTSTLFSLGTDATVNANGGTYVAYLFAHDAGGFGDDGTDNIISCGSFVISSSNTTVNLGYEPQYLLVKRITSTARSWEVVDNMRGFTADGSTVLYPNENGGDAGDSKLLVTSTGFTATSTLGNATYIYMAIRRPMKTPTSGTEVFSPVTWTGNGTTQTISTGNVVLDTFLNKHRTSTLHPAINDRLRGAGYSLLTSSTGAEIDNNTLVSSFGQSSVVLGSSDYVNGSAATYIGYAFKRARGFFDVVCYTGNGSTQTISHNLNAVPEIIIVKSRSTAGTDWFVYTAAEGTNRVIPLNNNAAAYAVSNTFTTTPTSTEFYLGSQSDVNGSSRTYVAYLFATLNGVSKIGTYTGNGSNQTINCGFTAGARFVLIRRTDSSGDWCVFDTARGIVSGNDPFLQLNTTDAEVTGEDAVDPENSGFIVNQTTENLNVNNATYIYLAIA